jgi:hypothetical protein
MTKRRVILALVLVLLLIGGAGAWYFRPNPDVEKVKTMGNELIEKAKESLARGEFIRPDSEQAKELKQAMEKLSPEERREVGLDMGLNFMNTMSTMIVNAPEPLRNFVLDKAIDQMEADRKRREERRAQAEAEGRDPNQPSGQGQGADDSRRGERRMGTPEEREKFMKKFLDKTKPQDRARLVVAFQMLDDRRKQRGLPPMPFMGGPRTR